jgi:membrane protease YdiL (CAAX protease family)
MKMTRCRTLLTASIIVFSASTVAVASDFSGMIGEAIPIIVVAIVLSWVLAVLTTWGLYFAFKKRKRVWFLLPVAVICWFIAIVATAPQFLLPAMRLLQS